ncbi:unnamed protein product [Rhizoctonia solani]|uniref:Uncharacterized protein n=1 Tax=Rhizoctonia solani TaxID=456999 RepID=A0A8H3B0T0_9AGAM|nr:unnamed protein product [Rhizoctonia solani]CAE6457147.1 unnamed protein product [Rhizoctonia solani]
MLNHRFMSIADRALQAVADSGHTKWDKDRLQKKLDETVVYLKDYCETFSGPGNIDYDPIELMLDARTKDQERSLEIVAVDKLTKVPKLKTEVIFYIHDCSGAYESLLLNISKKSTSEELLFKLGRRSEAGIKLHESAHFYVGPDITWKKEALHINLGSEVSTYRYQRGLSDFKLYFDRVQRGPVHVFVDRGPSIHLFLTTENWSRLFSLARLIDNEKIVVLKGTDGTLYHAKQVLGQLELSDAVVFRFNWETNRKDRIEVGLTTLDCTEILLEARTYILSENRHRAAEGWLVEVHPKSSEPPDVLKQKPRIQHRRRIIQYTLPGPTSTGDAPGDPLSATARVKNMIEKLERERKEVEEKDKRSKKGFFGRVFGK